MARGIFYFSLNIADQTLMALTQGQTPHHQEPERELHRKVTAVSIACLMGAATSAFYLYQDLMSVGRDGVGKPVAKVAVLEDKVRRKAMGAFTWTLVERLQPLYRRDSIQTGPGSSVSLELADGKIIELGEQSLVVLEDSSDLALQFVKGTGVVHGKDGDSKITVDQDGKTKLEALPIRISSPQTLAEFFTSEDRPYSVAFQWEATDPAQPLSDLALEISSDRAFRKNQTQLFSVAGTTQWKYTSELKPGQYFWRVSKKGEIIAPSRSFHVLAPTALRPVEPTRGAKVSRWGEKSTNAFRWQALESDSGSIQYRIEISKDPSFAQIAHQAQIEPSSGLTRVTGLGHGQYHWRLVTSFPDGLLKSSTETFALEQKKNLVVDLRYPEPGSQIEIRPELRFSWRAEADAALDYEWEVVTAKGEPVARAEGQTAAALWKSPSPGIYRWKVVAKFEGVKVGESPWRSVSVYAGKAIALQSPPDRSSITYWDQPKPFNFTWSDERSRPEQRYRIEISTEPQFEKLVRSQDTDSTQVTSTALALPEGDYFWRVKLVEQDFVVKTTKPFAFKYGRPPLLAAPDLRGPEPGKKFNPLEKEEFPILTWKSVEGAQGYELIIHYRDQRAPASATESGKEFRRIVVRDTEYELKDLKLEGKYSWTVRPIDRIKRPGEEAPAKSFEFTYGKRLIAPKILAPEVQ